VCTGVFAIIVVLFPISALGYAILANLGWDRHLGVITPPASLFAGLTPCAVLWCAYELARKLLRWIFVAEG
jgi:hypothetical protein